MNHSKEISPKIKCVIKDKVCYIEKIIDHFELGCLVKYHKVNDEVDFCLVYDLSEDVFEIIKNKYPEYLI